MATRNAPALLLRPGDRALLEVEIYDFPTGDMTNVRVAAPGFAQRFWVPTALLRLLIGDQAHAANN
jgi:hypothetical protein